jgi:hypothetical protein
MIKDIPKPKISSNFTIDDIHKIRQWNYERLKDATLDERLKDIREGAQRTLDSIEILKIKK